MGEAVRGERLSQPYWKLNRDGPREPAPVPPLQGVRAVDAGFSDSDMSCSPPSWTCPPHQAPCNPWERPLRGPQETASAACALASAWAGIWKASEWHPPCCSPLCPAMGSLACASAPQAQVCYMFPSGISKGA